MMKFLHIALQKIKKVFITYEGKTVTTLNSKRAEKFIADIENSDSKDSQLIMAKITGNFKRGSEKLFKT